MFAEVTFQAGGISLIPQMAYFGIDALSGPKPTTSPLTGLRLTVDLLSHHRPNGC